MDLVYLAIKYAIDNFNLDECKHTREVIVAVVRSFVLAVILNVIISVTLLRNGKNYLQLGLCF